MMKSGLVISALLLLSASVANADTPPAAPGSQGAASVQKNMDADRSGGKADKGLTNAEEHITAEHGKSHEKEGKEEKREERKEKKDKKEERKERGDKAEHHDHHDHADRPAKPERPGK